MKKNACIAFTSPKHLFSSVFIVMIKIRIWSFLQLTMGNVYSFTDLVACLEISEP